MNFQGLSFSNSYWFLAGVIPLILCFHVWLSKGQSVFIPMDKSGIKNRKFISILLNLSAMIPPLIFMVVIFILAGPKVKGKPQQERQFTNIQICLDASGSMRAKMGSKSRYEVAMEAVKNFTEYRDGDAFGLTVFGTQFINWVPLTKDTSAIALATPFLAPDKMSSWFGGTNIASALEGCEHQLMKQQEGDRMIILLSDGRSSNPQATVAMAQELQKKGIIVYSIYIGDQATSEMSEVANITGGKVFGVNNPEALEATFRHIDQMEKTKYLLSEPKEEDYFRPFSQIALAGLSIMILTLFGLRYTPW